MQAEVAKAKTRFERAGEREGEDRFVVVAGGVAFVLFLTRRGERASVVEGLLGFEGRHGCVDAFS